MDSSHATGQLHHQLVQRLRLEDQRLHSRNRLAAGKRSDHAQLLQHRAHRFDHLLLRRRSARCRRNSSSASTQATATTQAASGSEFVAIAAGGPAESNSGGGDYSFVADEDFAGGGENAVSSATINLAQPGANAAPMAVYQHARAGISTYTIPGLTAGSSHTVLLHFAETYFTAAGQRVFNVAINGTSVLANFDIYANVGVNAAIVKQFTATANASGQIVIALSNGTADQPVISGIEIR